MDSRLHSQKGSLVESRMAIICFQAMLKHRVSLMKEWRFYAKCTVGQVPVLVAIYQGFGCSFWCKDDGHHTSIDGEQGHISDFASGRVSNEIYALQRCVVGYFCALQVGKCLF